MSDALDNDIEIHTFAAKIGLRRAWFHHDHYDVRGEKKALALQLGAIPCRVSVMVGIRQAKRTWRCRDYLVKPPTMDEVRQFLNEWTLENKK